MQFLLLTKPPLYSSKHANFIRKF